MIDFNEYALSRNRHLTDLQKYSSELYDEATEFSVVPLKKYQDLLALKLIKETLPKGARVLEIGGANSRVLESIHLDYECWNADKFEGFGNGPISNPKLPYKVVFDYIGNFNKDIPDNYFDFVFSISVMEHIVDSSQFQPIIDDINRILKPGGLSAQLFDITLSNNGDHWMNELARQMLIQSSALTTVPDLDFEEKSGDLYTMSEKAFNLYWAPFIPKSYQDYGRPSCLNVFWRKP